MVSRSRLAMWLTGAGFLCFGFVIGRSPGAHEATPFSEPPGWSRNAVWYQIFPERFRNGDPSNDPKPVDLTGSWPHVVAPGWQVSSWTGDWYKLQPWESRDDKGFYFHDQQRRYGGDLQGVLDRLDYLRNLGINAIYFNPIFESPSLHKYDATYYHHVDNNFGPDPEGDRKLWSEENSSDPSTWKWSAADKLFLRLIQEAHRRGIKVIIDGVFNHVGMTFWAFEDVKRNQERSLYKDWFIIKRWDDPRTGENEFEYGGWNGVKELPEVREDDRGIVTGPREHIHAVVQRWMDPNGDGNPEDGIDGWRLDVAEMVNPLFWREFRTWVRTINPEGYLVGEVWWEDWKNEKMFNPAPWLKGDVFDAVMNYRWAREAVRFFAGKGTKITASEFSKRVEALLAECRTSNNQALMNLYDSHDTDRLGSRIVNPDLSYDKHVGVNDNRSYDIRKPGKGEIQTQKLMALFQLTFVGAPTIYYGTESGMWGADDPDCRKPMLWDDLVYASERSHPFGTARPVDENTFNKDLHDWYTQLGRARQSLPALRTGTLSFVTADDGRAMVAYVRELGKERVLVILNNSETGQEHWYEVPEAGRGAPWSNVLTGESVSPEKGRLTTMVSPKSGIILKQTIP